MEFWRFIIELMEASCAAIENQRALLLKKESIIIDDLCAVYQVGQLFPHIKIIAGGEIKVPTENIEEVTERIKNLKNNKCLVRSERAIISEIFW